MGQVLKNAQNMIGWIDRKTKSILLKALIKLKISNKYFIKIIEPNKITWRRRTTLKCSMLLTVESVFNSLTTRPVEKCSFNSTLFVVLLLVF